MKLTPSNAEQFVGKRLTGGMWHYWPLKVVKLEDGYAVVDRNHVMMPLNEDDPIIFEEVIE